MRLPGTHRTRRKNEISGGLPGRANATIRSPAAPVASLRSGLRHGPAPLQGVGFPGL